MGLKVCQKHCIDRWMEHAICKADTTVPLEELGLGSILSCVRIQQQQKRAPMGPAMLLKSMGLATDTPNGLDGLSIRHPKPAASAPA